MQNGEGKIIEGSRQSMWIGAEVGKETGVFQASEVGAHHLREDIAQG